MKRKSRLRVSVKTTYTPYVVFVSVAALVIAGLFVKFYFFNSESTFANQLAENGPFNKALVLDGDKDCAAIKDLTLNTTYANYTVEAWVKTRATKSQSIVSFDRSEYFRLEMEGTGKVLFGVKTDKGLVDLKGSLIVNDGKWHHVTGMFAAGKLSIYVDGILDVTQTKGTTMGSGKVRYGFVGVGSEATTFNGTRGPTNYFEGEIDEVRMWSVARTEADLRASMCKKLTGTETGLVLNYSFDTDVLSVTDKGKNKYNSTLEGNALIKDFGAPVGSKSSSVYGAGNKELQFTVDGDVVKVTAETGTWNGVHIYQIPQSPENIKAPNGIKSIEKSKYWGVFVVSPNGLVYNFTVNYSKFNSLVSQESNITMVDAPSSNQLWGSVLCGASNLEVSKKTISKSSSESLVFALALRDPSFNETTMGKPGSGTALSLNGAEYVALNSFYSQQNQIQTLTVETWVKTSVKNKTWTDNWSLLDYDRSEYFNLFVRGDNGQVGFATSSKNGNNITLNDQYSTIAVNDGNWHHIAAVYDGKNKYIYVDGVLSGTVNNPHSGKGLGTGVVRYGFIGDGSESTTFNGARNGYYFEGEVDEMRVWNGVRSATEIRQNMCVKLKGTETNLANYYRFDESEGTMIRDNSCKPFYGVIQSKGNNWVTSGAAIGDSSVFVYGSNDLVFDLGAQGKFTFSKYKGTLNGVHVYHINQAPNDTAFPSNMEIIRSDYWGVYFSGSGVEYTFNFDFNKLNVSKDYQIKVAERKSNNSSSWNTLDITVNNDAKTISRGERTGTEYIIGFQSITILPIELVYFDAKKDGDRVNLTWMTAIEENNDYFTIERSADGIMFEELTTVTGAGNSKTSISYEWIDYDTPEGLVYYKLKQTDYNGAFSYSDIISLSNGNKNDAVAVMSIVPNPVESEFRTFVKSDKDGEIMLNVVQNSTGQTVFTKKVQVKAGVTEVHGQLSSDLQEGMYLLQIIRENDDAYNTAKLLKK